MSLKPPTTKKMARKPAPSAARRPRGIRGLPASLPGLKNGGKKC